VHEWSLAEGIYRAALEFAEAQNVKEILEIEVGVGELMQLDLDIMKEAFHMLAKGSIMEGANIIFKIEKAEFKCEKCGYTWDFETAKEQIARNFSKDRLIKNEEGALDLPLHYMPDLIYALATCPKCGSSNFLVTQGREVKIRKIVVKK